MLIGTGEYTKNISICSVLNDINSMVVIDHLTSLYNRRFLDDRLPVDIIKATLNKKPMSVIFIDINSMKTINDTFGHIEGDNALKLVGKSIKQSIRNTDWAARYGGDEFFICLNNMTNEDANIISEKISNRITSEALHIKGNVVKITVSAGVATMLDKAFTADEIIKLADEKMYEAKKRNK
jgi:diguanylate cyclase (GGDEF)-like protein